MDLEFWKQRWQAGQTGFHQVTVNPYLQYFYGEKGIAENKRSQIKVFVPLCGKSLDMLWLAQQGYAVFGVECSKMAVEAFFTENGLEVQVSEAERASADGEQVQHGFYRHSGQRAAIEIYQGDFFDLQPADLQGVTDVFDRASLIALPPAMRKAYVRHMAACLKPGVRVLLVTLTYPQQEMSGPPFSVTEEEVHALYQGDFDIEKLLNANILEKESHFKAKGLSKLTESVYKLVKKG